MIFKRSLSANAFLSLFVFACWGHAQEAAKLGPYFWPTPNPGFVQHGEMEGVLQPTVSGRITSGLFGCVRNGGHRFHEGLDLRATAWDRRKEATDPIFAFSEGTVRYVNSVAGNSSYGRYIVIEHPQIGPGVVSLYAHLSAIESEIEAGVSVDGGQAIAVMGRSAGGYSIPRSRAHLHFELGFWLGPDFQTWYDQQPYDSKNEHGSYNGMNIVGADVWALCGALRRGEAADAWEYLMSEQIAVEAFVRDTSIPDLLKVNPYLMHNEVIPPDHAGWRVELTWYGLPTRFKALTGAEMKGYEHWLTVDALRPDLLEGNLCLDLAKENASGGVGSKVNSLMKRMFLR
ncbi:M23 family metallopeptidase [Pelagicoccus sp. SDUM812002]|uniref:M23 family metallopeptidase n=1 Tax=Pelagicoccus sp. SDUM812002 TaxID=3041266 RepID=UPI00280F5254|nr:M23 family metallopeptidase [Pelagicoccus sp. SDUM812002]MDQ8185243.1 M23 family metallopeptidase [Pelagicoccus sp. SDUM812002]